MEYIAPIYEKPVDELDMRDEGKIDDYLDAAKTNHQLDSDRQLARELKVSSSAVNAWRRGVSWPTDKIMIRISWMAEADADDALLHLNYWRTKSPEAKKMYATILSAIYRAKGPNTNGWWMRHASAILILCGLAGHLYPIDAQAQSSESVRMEDLGIYIMENY